MRPVKRDIISQHQLIKLIRNPFFYGLVFSWLNVNGQVTAIINGKAYALVAYQVDGQVKDKITF